MYKISWRYLQRHPLQSALMILGITLGVAVVIAIDLANESASTAFDLSVDSVAGRATHQLVGGPAGLDETIYVELRRAGVVNAAAPVITEYVTSPQMGNRPLRLLGIDPFADLPFRSYLGSDGQVALDQLTTFLTQSGAILISTDLAQQYELEIGSRVTLDVGGRQQAGIVGGLLEPADDLSRRALDGLILTDIATAQELTGRIGRLDHIDLILPTDDPTAASRVAALLPEGVQLTPSSARSGTVEQMASAFRINLTALSLLALLVGVFLIYNTMTFSVVQRRPLFGTLRCLGVTRYEIFLLMLGEALVIGILGTTLGVAMGVAMGQAAVRMVTQTINDLYFVLTVQGVQLPIASLLKGVALGIGATVLTAALPAWEAASITPHAALLRSGLESKARQAVVGNAIAGLLLITLGSATLLIPTRDLAVSFGGTFMVIVGIAMLTPHLMALLMRGAGSITEAAWGTLGRMAPRSVIASLSRTAIAVAALMVAISVTIGVSLMVTSFRHTVVLWLAQTLQSDIYISVPGGTSTAPSMPIDPAVLSVLRTWPGVERVDRLRAATVESPGGPVDVAAVDNPDDPHEQVYLSVELPPDQVWEAMLNGSVLVSEPFARRMELPRHGGMVTLYTDQGPRTFPVIGIYYDYASSQGTVLMSLNLYRALWDDDSITAIALRLEPGIDVDQTVRRLRETLEPIQRLRINPNRALREEVLTIFDRTFAITGALQLLATVVAFIGVLSALLSLQLEKQRELGILRAIGLTARQLWGLAMIETGLMGMVAGLLAMPTGYALALILVYIINRRAFGWTLQMQIVPAPFALALAVAVIAALLAGIYPAYRMSRMAAADAIRFE